MVLPVTDVNKNQTNDDVFDNKISNNNTKEKEKEEK